MKVVRRDSRLSYTIREKNEKETAIENGL
jgi:hypothetical protein